MTAENIALTASIISLLAAIYAIVRTVINNKKIDDIYKSIDHTYEIESEETADNNISDNGGYDNITEHNEINDI